MLGPLPARELTDLATEPYQEFLTLILRPRIAFLCGYCLYLIEVKNAGSMFRNIFLFWVMDRVILVMTSSSICVRRYDGIKSRAGRGPSHSLLELHLARIRSLLFFSYPNEPIMSFHRDVFLAGP